MSATPPSCSAEGDSSRIAHANSTESTGWNVSSTEVSAAGSRGSVIEISSHPSAWELSASSNRYPCAFQPGVQSRLPQTSPIGIVASAQKRVASKSGPAGRRRSRLLSRRTSRKAE